VSTNAKSSVTNRTSEAFFPGLSLYSPNLWLFLALLGSCRLLEPSPWRVMSREAALISNCFGW
jgi:hypothetical protein